MIHIVFQQADIAALEKSFELDPTLKGDILLIADDFAVGPLADPANDSLAETRKQWWREVLAGGDYEGIVDDGSVPDDEQSVRTIIKRLHEDAAESAWIWAAQNAHDVSGYYWLVSRLRELQGRIFILYLNNLPFLNEKGHIFYPVTLSAIAAREFVKAKKLARPITPAEMETDPDEWTRLSGENKGVRILEGGKKLSQHDYSFFDAELVKGAGNEWIKASKLIHQFLSKARHTTGDAYLLWRLKQIIAGGALDVQGEVRNMKEFEVKLKSATVTGTV